MVAAGNPAKSFLLYKLDGDPSNINGLMRGEELLVEAHVQVAFVSGGRARPIPKPLRIAMKADQESGQESGGGA